jgi:transposase InsO family protein
MSAAAPPKPSRSAPTPPAASAAGSASTRSVPESQAFIESWFSKLKLRCVWREQFETLDQARAAIATYIDAYHHRPHSGLAYRTPAEVAQTWKVTTT